MSTREGGRASAPPSEPWEKSVRGGSLSESSLSSPTRTGVCVGGRGLSAGRWCGPLVQSTPWRFVGGDGDLAAALHSKGQTASFQHDFTVYINFTAMRRVFDRRVSQGPHSESTIRRASRGRERRFAAQARRLVLLRVKLSHARVSIQTRASAVLQRKLQWPVLLREGQPSSV